MKRELKINSGILMSFAKSKGVDMKFVSLQIGQSFLLSNGKIGVLLITKEYSGTVTGWMSFRQYLGCYKKEFNLKTV